MQIVRKMTELEAFEVLSVVLKHPVLVIVYYLLYSTISYSILLITLYY